jgi:chitinase
MDLRGKAPRAANGATRRRPDPSRRAFALFVSALLAGCAGPAPARYELVGYYAGWNAPRFPPTPRTSTRARSPSSTTRSSTSAGTAGTGTRRAAASRRASTRTASPRGPERLGRAWKRDARPGQPGTLLELKRANPGLKLVGSVGGWTWSNRFSDMASSAATRRNFVDSVVAFLRRHRFDGIDLDWEYPGEIGRALPAGRTPASDPRTNATSPRSPASCAQRSDAAGRADGKRYLATIAAGADDKFVFDAAGSAAWLVELAASLDWINVMTYDYHGSWEKVERPQCTSSGATLAIPRPPTRARR